MNKLDLSFSFAIANGKLCFEFVRSFERFIFSGAVRLFDKFFVKSSFTFFTERSVMATLGLVFVCKGKLD